MYEYKVLWKDSDGKTKVLAGKFASLPLNPSQTPHRLAWD